MSVSTSRSLLLLVGLIVCWMAAGWGDPGQAQERGRGPASNRKAIAYYSDAAGYQNKGAYKLAIEEWNKLLQEFPKDPLASKAWHYLGVCYTQVETPDYVKAAAAFEQALKDEKLDVREESLINLSWSLFSQARAAKPNSAQQRAGLERARGNLTEFLKSYGEGSYIDQALFYLGEIEYSLGDIKRSIPYYKRLLETPSLGKSSLRPGGTYALAVAYEEAQQDSLAQQLYKQFLKEFPEHNLTGEVSVRLADLLLKQGQADTARTLLSNLVQQDAGTMTDYALLRLGYAASTLGDTAAAVDHYSQLLKDFPESKHAATAALSLGQSLNRSGQLEEALEKFAQVLPAQDEQAAEAAHWMAITLLRLNKPQQAVKLVEDSLAWSQSSRSAVNLLMDYADALYAIPSELERSRVAYERILHEHPDDPLASRAAYNAAFAALQGRKLPEAQKWAEWFLNRFPQDPLRNDVAVVAAEVLLQQGEHAAAVAAYTKLRQADPQNPAADQWLLRIASAHYAANDYAAAVEVLAEAVKQLKNPNQLAEAQFLLGASYLYQEQIPQAIEQLKSSHATSDAWSSADEVLLILSEAYQRHKDNQSARSALEKLLQKYPQTRLKSQVDYKLAQLSAAAGEFDEALSLYESIVAKPEAAGYHNFASYGSAWCLMQQEKYGLALERLQPLLALKLRDSIGAEAKLAEGVCLRKTGKAAQAIPALEEFLTLRPTGTSLANGLYELGLAYTEQKQLPQATAAFTRIVSEVPDYPALDKVLYELAWNHQESGHLPEALEAFQQLAERFPASEFQPEALYMVAQQQYESESYARAAEIYTSVLNRAQDAELREKTQYKLGWSFFQQAQHAKAATQFAEQARSFPKGALAVDAQFMLAECAFKQEKYEQALPGYQQARQALEAQADTTAASDQVKSLIYLHAAQCLRELGRWDECEQWLNVITRDYPQSPYLWSAVYELGYCKQQQEEPVEALRYYGQVVEHNRNELGARARFMMGEVYFSQRDFQRAIEEFTRVAYGFGGERAPQEIKNWQAKSAYEAARCYEVLAPDLRGDSRLKAVEGARKFYEDILRDHAQHELASQASSRLGELRKLR